MFCDLDTMTHLRLWINLTVFTMYVFLSVTAFTTGVSEVTSRSLSVPLTNMVSFEGKLYVGGGNHIYLLDKDLNVIQTTSTCEFSTQVCEASRNVNKILLICRKQGLITCGTGNYGTCDVRNVSNIREIFSTSLHLLNSRKYLKVSTDAHKPAQGVITQNGELTLAVTFGKGLKQIMSGNGLSLTYNYAVSTRTLPDFFLDRKTEKKTLRLKIQQPSINDYLVYYKASFQSNWMTYFVTNQKSVVGAKDYVSKLVRICQNDTGYSSYTDIAIQCKFDGVQFNLIQDAILLDSLKSTTSSNSNMVFVGVFARGNDPENAIGDTVVCMTDLQLLNDAIMAAKKDFATSCEDTDSATRYLLSYKERCINEMDYNEQVNMCENIIPKIKNVIGKTPYIMESSFKVSQNDGIVTTLHGTVFNRNRLVLIFGTSTGNFIQTNLLEDLSVEEYGRKTVEGSYPIRKIHAEDDDTLYVLTSHTVTKYFSTRCSEYQTCADVMSIKNPLCGWCVYKERATRKSACLNATNHWLSSRQNCVSVSVEPSGISIAMSSKPSYVTLRLQNIPMKQNGDTYSCRFISGSNLLKHTDVVTVTKNTFSCKLPELSVHTEVIIEFLVKMQTGSTALLSSEHLLYFDCAFYSRCVECISTIGIKCHWCSRSATCQEPNTCSMQMISDPTSCPKLLHTRDRHFIHDRIQTTVTFRAANLINDQVILYKCTVQGTNIQIEAYANSSSVSCSLNIMKTADKRKEDFRIVVNYGPNGGQLAEINDDFLNFVTVYSCKNLATDCIHCQALNKTRYSCDWYKPSQCIHITSHNRSTQCPAPSITKVIPRNGPSKGGTFLTIFGTNLGNTISDVENITVAGIPCVLSSNTEDYHITHNQDFETFPPSRLVCTTQAAHQEIIGMVNVTVDGQSSKLSVEFAYKIPIVTGIYPKCGPKAGGTRITLYGKNLGVGERRVSVTLGGKRCNQRKVYPKLPLDIEEVGVNFAIQCTVANTYDKPTNNITYLSIKMDGGPAFYTKTFYSFVADPIVTAVYPKKGFVSGGSAVNIGGKHLDNAHLAVIRLQYAGESKKEKCETVSSELTICKVPSAPPTIKTEILSLAKTKTEASFDSIGVAAVLGLDGVMYKFTITYVRDPVIHSISGDGNTVTLDPHNPRLHVNGEHLNLVATSFDIRITVGIETCAIINLTSVSIICVAPAGRPRSGIPDLENPEVNVTIGNIHKTVGYVRYVEEDCKIVVIVISTVLSVVLAVLFVVGMILICRFYIRMKEKVRRLKRPKDSIEMTVLTSESSRYTTACSYESKGIYADIAEDDMQSYNSITEEDRNYDKPVRSMEVRPYLNTSETDIQRLLTETVKPLKVSSYIHPCYDDFDGNSLHRFSLKYKNQALHNDGDTNDTPSVPKETVKESQGSVYIQHCSDDFHRDFLHRSSLKINGTSLSDDIDTYERYRMVRESTTLPQNLGHSDGFNDDCLHHSFPKNDETTLTDEGDEDNTHIVQREIAKRGSDYDHPCCDDIDVDDTYNILRETEKQSQGLYYIHPYCDDLDDDYLLRTIRQNNSPAMLHDEDADDTYNVLRETAKQSQGLYYIHPCSEDINDEDLPDGEDTSGTHNVLTETTKMSQSLDYIHPCSNDLDDEKLFPYTL